MFGTSFDLVNLAQKWKPVLRKSLFGAAALFLSGAVAQAETLTIWSWHIAAAGLRSTLEDFNKEYPDVELQVEDLSAQQVLMKALAACSAGGEGLPDIISVQNMEAESLWYQFPDCFANLNELGYTPQMQARFPDFKRTELEVEGIAYAVPWDSGPVAMFYRRDFYAKAGVDPADIKTWDDFIEMGQKIMTANPGVVMAQADFNGEGEWFRMLANEQDCSYFSSDSNQIRINHPGCVLALEKIKQLRDAGLITAANWEEKIQSNNAGKVAGQLYGAWYDGVLRSQSPDLAGKWGVYRMPSLAQDGSRAANVGGSSLAIANNSKNKDIAWKFVEHALITDEGQITMLKSNGLVPSLLSAIEDPYLQEPQPYYDGQKIWPEILATLPLIAPVRGTQFHVDAESIFVAVQQRYFAGEYDSAKAALDDAAKQIERATGLPIATP